jgi:hypothetical protein
MKQRRNILFGFQSGYYLLSGLWPLVDITSFMEVTGYKTDLWLVKTVSVLILAITFTFILALVRKEYVSSLVFLSASSAAGLLAIDLYYAINDTISDVYFIDAAAQLIIILAWIVIRVAKKQKQSND